MPTAIRIVLQVVLTIAMAVGALGAWAHWWAMLGEMRSGLGRNLLFFGLFVDDSYYTERGLLLRRRRLMFLTLFASAAVLQIGLSRLP